MNLANLIPFALITLVGYACVTHFGWVNGLALVAALYLLMPYRYFDKKE